MSRVINPNAPGKARNKMMRTSAELIKRLSQKTEVDDDVRNMVAMLVFCFREIDESVDMAISAWEKRDYWIKAARFRNDWLWVKVGAEALETILRNEQWELLPSTLIEFVPQFEDIKIARYTRSPSEWAGAYDKLLEEQTTE